MKNEDLYRVDRPDVDHIPRGDMEAWQAPEPVDVKKVRYLDHRTTRLGVLLLASLGIPIHAFSGSAIDAILSAVLFGAVCYASWRIPSIEERWTRHVDNIVAVLLSVVDSTSIRHYRPYRRGIFQLFIGAWAVSALFMLLIPSLGGLLFGVSLLGGLFLLMLACSRRSLREVRKVGRQMTLLIAGHGAIGLIADQGGFLCLIIAVGLLLLDKQLLHLYKEEG